MRTLWRISLLQLVNTNYCSLPYGHMDKTRLVFFSEIFSDLISQSFLSLGATTWCCDQLWHLRQYNTVPVTDLLHSLFWARLKWCMGGLVQISWRAFWASTNWISENAFWHDINVIHNFTYLSLSVCQLLCLCCQLEFSSASSPTPSWHNCMSRKIKVQMQKYAQASLIM